MKGSLRTLPQEGDLYKTTPDPSQLYAEWDDDKVELQEEQTESKNEFQRDIDNPKALPEVSSKKYDLEDKVKVWSDYLYSRFHPKTVNIVNDYQHCNEQTPFDSFSLGAALWKSDIFEDEFSDKIRSYIEECDHFQVSLFFYLSIN